MSSIACSLIPILMVQFLPFKYQIISIALGFLLPLENSCLEQQSPSGWDWLLILMALGPTAGSFLISSWVSPAVPILCVSYVIVLLICLKACTTFLISSCFFYTLLIDPKFLFIIGLISCSLVTHQPLGSFLILYKQDYYWNRHRIIRNEISIDHGLLAAVLFLAVWPLVFERLIPKPLDFQRTNLLWPNLWHFPKPVK